MSSAAPKLNAKAIIVCGQPGTGISALLHNSVFKNPVSEKPVLIDRLRLAQEDPMYIDYYLRQSAKGSALFLDRIAQLSSSLINRAIEGNNNIVIGGELFNNNELIDLCRLLKSRHYVIEMKLLAVNPALSQLHESIVYDEMIATIGLAKPFIPDDHRNACFALTKLLGEIQVKCLANKVSFYDSLHNLVYTNDCEIGRWRKNELLAAKLEQFRARPWCIDQHSAFVDLVERALHLANKRMEQENKYLYLVSSEKNHAELLTSDIKEAVKKFLSLSTESIPMVFRAQATSNKEYGTNNHELMTAIEPFTNKHRVVQLKKTALSQFTQFHTLFNLIISGGDQKLKSVSELRSLLQTAKDRQRAFLSSQTYKRAVAFEAMPEAIALKKFPELNTSFKLITYKSKLAPSLPKKEVSEKLRHGELKELEKMYADIEYENNPSSAQQVLLVQAHDVEPSHELDFGL